MKNVTYRQYNRVKWYLRLLSLFIAFALSPDASAHIGSSGVIVQKKAGKYQVLVSVQPPDVVPGTAKVIVFVEQGRVERIVARPVYFRSGDKGAPTHDELTRTEGNRYEGDLWLMDSGSSSIEIKLEGADGSSTVVVPVLSVSTALRTMPEGTGIGLALMGLLLIVMMITIIGASTADGITPPGQLPQPIIRRKRFIGMGIGALVLALALTGWRSWWTSSAEDYRNEQLYQPASIRSSVSVADAQRKLTIQMDTTGFGTNWQKRRMLSYIMPDHGKLMHTFLVRMPGLDAFAHLHPDRRDTLNYESKLPSSLPGGRYLLYSDVVYRSGFTETLTDTVDLPSLKISNASAVGATPTDRDDSWLVAEPMGVKGNAVNVPHLDNDMVVCGKPGASAKLTDGSTMLWMDKPDKTLETGKLYTLKFAVADAAGKAAPLEPYLGMGGHAAILRSDGTVYIHLHPVGTYSMAAEGSLVSRLADTARTFRYPDATRFRDSIDAYVAKLKTLPEKEKNQLLMANMPGVDSPSVDTPEMNHQMAVNNMVQFPYAFPRAGHYRIWVQVKRNGQVLTGVFDTEVNDPLL